MTNFRIPRLVGKTNKAGVTSWYWQPSATLAKEGWKSVALGKDEGTAIAAARARNAEVAAGKAPNQIVRRIERLQRHQQWLERTLSHLRRKLADAHAGDKPTVYFIMAEDGPIKIGVSIDPAMRLRDIQTTHPKPLRLLARVDRGGFNLEREYHQRFADHRLNGEWFRPHPDIIAEIQRIRIEAGEAALLGENDTCPR